MFERIMTGFGIGSAVSFIMILLIASLSNELKLPPDIVGATITLLILSTCFYVFIKSLFSNN